MSRSTFHDLTQGSVSTQLWRMTWPMLIAMSMLMSFNFVDAYFVSMLGTEQLAAFSFTFPVTFTVISLVIGLGVGTSATVANTLGQGDTLLAKHQGGVAVVLSGALVLILCLVVWLLHDPIFLLIGATPETLPVIGEFMDVWLLGGIFVAFPMVGNAVMRANGNTRLPSLVMALSAAVNVALDPLLIFGLGPFPEMGLQGAALATVIGYGVSSVFILYMLFGKMKAIAWKANWSCRIKAAKTILHIALPASGSNMLTPVAMAGMTAIIAQYGQEAVAAFGVGGRLESLVTMVILTLSMTLPPFISQNYAAGRHDRVRAAYEGTIKFVMLFQAVLYLLLFLMADHIGSAFGQDAEVAGIIALLVVILPLAYGAQGVVILSNSSLNALHRPMGALGLNMIRLFAMYLPLAFIGGKIAGLTGVFVGATTANFITAYIAWRIVNTQLCPAKSINAEEANESSL
ncbi:MATE family efflux transporter [Ferrimonas sp. YFM]|uniref:MATE family efflux transporter n=1 Tax=Ferrimonas sp. YFM TaxID=3028878 RepID=UPI002573BC60|nr:MATE family efflux transporter [Ferrimonas sp. YFM]BDY05335.1 MATE family efflux transporter [Ferrimonas sp. YFM]